MSEHGGDGLRDETRERVEAALRATSVIVPVKDDVRVEACLNSVDEDVDVVLALNAATDEVREIARRHPRRPSVVEIPEANLGAAYNAGVDASAGRFLLFMDSDCTFGPGTIRTLVTAVLEHPVVKGRVVFRSSGSFVSRLIEQSRTFQIADHVNAYSPPLIYDREIESAIGGYHYSSLIHWEEDREFDFRLQVAGIGVVSVPEATVVHAAQEGHVDLRSGYRYGLGEGVGQELGLFVTPNPLWRAYDDLRSVVQVGRRKGPAVAAYRVAWLAAYHAGTLAHVVADPRRVRPRYPDRARRVWSRTGVSGHSTVLDERHAGLLRAAHRRQGRAIGLEPWVRPPFEAPVAQMASRS